MKKLAAYFVVIFTVNLVIGTWAVNTILSWFSKDIPLWADALIGLFTAEVTTPIAIVGYILKACGVF